MQNQPTNILQSTSQRYRFTFKLKLAALGILFATLFVAHAEYYQAVPVADWQFYPTGLDNHDQVSGTLISSNGYGAAIWERGVITNLTPGLSNVWVLSTLASNGVFLANISDTGHTYPGAVLDAHDGVVAEIPSSSQSFQPAAVNANGLIVGTGNNGPSTGHACFYQNGLLTFLPDGSNELVFETSSKALAVNNRSQVVGSSMIPIHAFTDHPVTIIVIGAEEHATVWTTNGLIHDLGILPDYTGHFTTNYVNRYTRAVGNNDSGEVIGISVYQGVSSTFGCGFVYRRGAMEILTNCAPVSINSNGVVVGNYSSTGFLYDHGKFVTIRSLIDPRISMNSLTPIQINDSGEILVKSSQGSFILVPPAPLHLTPSINGITLQWPATLDGYFIETAAEATSSSWSPITNSVVVNGTNCAVDVTSSETQRFFRLRKSFQ